MADRITARRAERKEARRNRFLEVTIDLLGRHGYHATTVPMIVKEAGSSIGNFYFYFKNKEDICAALLVDMGRRIGVAVGAAIATQPSPVRQMKAAVIGLFTFLAENPEEARILLIETSSLSERLSRIRRTILDTHTLGVEQALRRLSAELPAMDCHVVAGCWVGAVFQAACNWLATPPGERPPAAEVAEEVARFNLRGIGAEEGAS